LAYRRSSGLNTFAGTDPKTKSDDRGLGQPDPTADGRAAATLIAKGLIDESGRPDTPR
jgi:hypothetical protein